ncbi:hypothetical protein BDN67DRAFT_1014328 [Paxillus ammoniavirescens]|nr:hypothetical protein BDN67DRAFT_1014328 [Paxillus ammoniavirescens]
MAHMKNLRKLEFDRFSVEKVHWDVIATLESLEQLVFGACTFVGGPADVDPGKRLKVKVPYLIVFGCDGDLQLSAAIDVRHLRTLKVDLAFADQVNWISGTALTKLHVFDFLMNRASHLRVKPILCQIPQSINVLRLPTDTLDDMDEWSDDVY